MTMAVGEIFKKLEKQVELDLHNRAMRTSLDAKTKIYNNLSTPEILFKKKQIAKEILWFFAALCIGFLMGYLFFELFAILLPDIKNEIISIYLHSNMNFIYALSIVCFIGVYVSRLVVWSLNLF
jgi:hypothetical protein